MYPENSNKLGESLARCAFLLHQIVVYGDTEALKNAWKAIPEAIAALKSCGIEDEWMEEYNESARQDG